MAHSDPSDSFSVKRRSTDNRLVFIPKRLGSTLKDSFATSPYRGDDCTFHLILFPVEQITVPRLDTPSRKEHHAYYPIAVFASSNGSLRNNGSPGSYGAFMLFVQARNVPVQINILMSFTCRMSERTWTCQPL